MLSDTATDDELMLLVKDGNKAAFTILFKRHSALVFGACMRFTQNAAKSEDASQEVWKRVVIYARSYESQSAFRPWIWQIARNTCLRELVKNKAFQNSVPEEDVEIADTFDVEADLGERHQAVKIRGAIDTLPEAQRAAILLWISGEQSYEEIAHQLACSVGAVKQLLFRAKQGLLAQLGEDK